MNRTYINLLHHKNFVIGIKSSLIEYSDGSNWVLGETLIHALGITTVAFQVELTQFESRRVK